MVKLDHDDVAQNADMGSVYDRLAEQFVRDTLKGVTAESAHLKPYDGVMQDDGWDNDCC